MAAITDDVKELAHDVGAPGVKVRPNGVPEGAEPDATFRQIGRCLNAVGAYGEGFGVEVRVEVHGARARGDLRCDQQHPDLQLQLRHHRADAREPRRVVEEPAEDA